MQPKSTTSTRIVYQSPDGAVRVECDGPRDYALFLNDRYVRSYRSSAEAEVAAGVALHEQAEQVFLDTLDAAAERDACLCERCGELRSDRHAACATCAETEAELHERIAAIRECELAPHLAAALDEYTWVADADEPALACEQCGRALVAADGVFVAEQMVCASCALQLVRGLFAPARFVVQLNARDELWELVDTHDGRVVERFNRASRALAQEEADLLNRRRGDDSAPLAVIVIGLGPDDDPTPPPAAAALPVPTMPRSRAEAVARGLPCFDSGLPSSPATRFLWRFAGTAAALRTLIAERRAA
jgi:hypothetical protein